MLQISGMHLRWNHAKLSSSYFLCDKVSKAEAGRATAGSEAGFEGRKGEGKRKGGGASFWGPVGSFKAPLTSSPFFSSLLPTPPLPYHPDHFPSLYPALL